MVMELLNIIQQCVTITKCSGVNCVWCLFAFTCQYFLLRFFIMLGGATAPKCSGACVAVCVMLMKTLAECSRNCPRQGMSDVACIISVWWKGVRSEQLWHVWSGLLDTAFQPHDVWNRLAILREQGSSLSSFVMSAGAGDWFVSLFFF